MAAFKQHIAFSSAFGLGYAATLSYQGVDLIHSALAGALCGFAGMLPDLDSDSGKPVREIFGVTAVLVPLLYLPRLELAGVNAEGKILFAAVAYLGIRFGLAWFFRRLTVHRGMFHSIPGAVISAEVVFLAHDCHEPFGGLTLAAGVLLGYLSHLLLDEIYSVRVSRLVPRLNKASGSALKLFSQSIPATLATWVFLTALTYVIGVEQGYLRPVHRSIARLVATKAAPISRGITSSVQGVPPGGN